MASRFLKIPVILGPTAVGKTTIAEKIAEKIGGEIISADSRQIYKKLSIGTAKPENPAVKYHLIDIIEPLDRYNAAQFISDTIAAVDEIKSRCKIPIIVGGTGLYIRALTEGIFPGEFRDEKIRRELQKRYAGGEDLYSFLEKVDPVAAKKIDRRNYVRIERALEVFIISGKPISYWWEHSTKPPTSYAFLKIGLMIEREKLYRRIDERVEKMLAAGWIEEVKKLLDDGISRDAPAFNSIGYRSVIKFIDGGISREGMMEEIKRDTRRYAKRQISWFKREKNVHWFDITNLAEEEIVEELLNLLKTTKTIY